MVCDANPVPSSKKTSNTYAIGGIQVEFPYQPYGSQMAFMSRVISTLDRARREGHCHALLESPTGTGKSLSLLCSALAWQRNYNMKSMFVNPNLAHSKPNPEAVTDPLAFGGGFIPESQPSSIPPSSNYVTADPAVTKKNKKSVPVIYYASRTHSQITQVISEYKKTAYRVPMAVLASRKHYCTNRHVRGKDNIDEECKLLLKKQDVGCPQFKNVQKVKSHPSLQKGGCHEVHDIEDLVKVGNVVRGCSYYAARSMADDAQLVFCPYSYVINPIVRGAMDVVINGAIVILDEAHNIEDIARDSGSVDIEEDVLKKLQTELELLRQYEPMIYHPLFEMIQDLISWIDRRKETLEKREFQHYISCWTGDKALRELQEANITQQCFPTLLECATRAIRESTDHESNVPRLSGMAITTLEGLFSALTFFFSKNGSYVFDYQLALQRCIRKEKEENDIKNSVGNWRHTLSLWCLNPAVVFRDIAELSLSVILTSGTLSPLNSFSSELGVHFGSSLEAPHVIDVESQVWASVITTGPGNYPLNASYKTADGYTFQDSLGKSLEEICNVVPGGSLVFFPSYKLMEKLCNRWRKTGQWTRLNVKKSLFVEPKGGSQEEFEQILKDYYESILPGNKPVVRKKRRVKKVNHFSVKESDVNTQKDGAALLAVCRGKVSEGIDFTDDNARVVIVVGIPFPNINDIQVSLKKKYNDTYRSSKNLITGNEWYCFQAFRALNQAIGRCIRHRFDYGAIILLDERFREERNQAYISKWLRKSIRQYDNFYSSLEGLKSFFRDVKERVDNNRKNVLQNSGINEEKIPAADQCKVFERKHDQKLNDCNHSGEYINTKSDCDVKISLQKYQEKDGFREYIDLESGEFIDNKNKYWINLRRGITNKNKKPNRNDNSEQKVSPMKKHNSPSPELKSSSAEEVQDTVVIDTNGNSCKDFIDLDNEDLECDRSNLRCCETGSTPFFIETPDLTVVKETPCSTNSPGSLSKDRNSCSTTFQASTQSPDQSASPSQSPANIGKSTPKAESGMAVTPKKDESGNTSSIVRDSAFSASVNSHTLKRRSISSSVLNLDRVSSRMEFGFETDHLESKSMKSSMSALVAKNDDVTSHSMKSSMSVARNDDVTSHSSSNPIMDKSLRISCSLCNTSVAHPDNNPYIRCSITSSSKVHLASLLKKTSETVQANVPNIPIIMTDVQSVHPRLCNRSLVPASSGQQGVWCEEDGCVYNNIFCPFCIAPKNCLGVQIVASNASNVQLLSKVLLYVDRLQIMNPETENDMSPKVVKDSQTTNLVDKAAALNAIERFSYSPSPLQEQNLGGWRTTRSKLRLPKRDLSSTRRA